MKLLRLLHAGGSNEGTHRGGIGHRYGDGRCCGGGGTAGRRCNALAAAAHLVSARGEASLLISSRNHITSVLITCVQLLGPKTEIEDRPTQATDTDKSLKQNSLHSSVLFFFCGLSSNLKIADPFASSAGHVMCNYN